jgi:hypothetical protein
VSLEACTSFEDPHMSLSFSWSAALSSGWTPAVRLWSMKRWADSEAHQNSHMFLRAHLANLFRCTTSCSSQDSVGGGYCSPTGNTPRTPCRARIGFGLHGPSDARFARFNSKPPEAAESSRYQRQHPGPLYKAPELAPCLTPCSAAVEHGAGRQPGVLQGPQLPGVGRPVQPPRTLLRHCLPRPDCEGLGHGQNTPASDHGRTPFGCRCE